ncbi:MAG: crossover junction endodeoxyribonuclease RuvC [Anaerolineaceae bacterium]|nr:crossover junction endodeoxyribonuclease RuvC [Anaerolineaceae bacterium]
MSTLGIDPGLGTTGYGFVQLDENGDLQLIDYGVILTPKKQPIGIRLQVLYEQLNDLLILHSPADAAVEKLFFSRNITTAINVGQARGVALLSLAEANIPIVEFSPPEIKQAVTGYGGATKRQIQIMVKSLLGMEEVPKPDDAADALAIAICQINRARYDSMVNDAF